MIYFVKTFLLQLITAGLKAQGMNVAPCATTGKAATVLFEGATIHRRFGPIPRDLNQDSTSLLELGLDKADVIKAADVVIIDEVSAMHKVVKFMSSHLTCFIVGSFALLEHSYERCGL